MVRKRGIFLIDSLVAIGTLALLVYVVSTIAAHSYRTHQRLERQREMMRIAERVALDLDGDSSQFAMDEFQVRVHRIESTSWARIEVIDGKHSIQLFAPIRKRAIQ